MIYGNDLKILKRVSAAGAFFAIVLLILFSTVAFTHGRLQSFHNFLLISFRSVICGSILPIFVAPSALFKIKVEDGMISKIFMGKYILKQNKVINLTKVTHGSRGSYITLEFIDGMKIKLAAYRLEVNRAVEDIRKLVQHPIDVD
jgi:hypothetical protein